ncbi:hypothetical protein BKP35_03820 [Anaerobacillus arseniciselenatis]|uniref:LysM domain-containing protein n=1 Tax=Anaerobacillus arseniciselenatis TaxID=85682 RepID=A0A1S2LXJ3_9BACI|nr:hypothetical protein [Anaerobacillus arseniciselenatis]OIJ16115.1 hypothetical protein BKP35_03820 [Anaerobacillus arseniciselenatis]
MKKLFITLLTIITIYSIYYDLNMGTLPQMTEAANYITEQHTGESKSKSELIEVQPGYTVLTIVEELHIGPVKASIQQIVSDFEQLNPGASASNIQVGKSYLFPLYQ